MLFDELRAIQREFGYLPPANLKELAATKGSRSTGFTKSPVSIPSFTWSLSPKSRSAFAPISRCHMRGADPLFNRLRQRFPPTNSRRRGSRNLLPGAMRRRPRRFPSTTSFSAASMRPRLKIDRPGSLGNSRFRIRPCIRLPGHSHPIPTRERKLTALFAPRSIGHRTTGTA